MKIKYFAVNLLFLMFLFCNGCGNSASNNNSVSIFDKKSIKEIVKQVSDKNNIDHLLIESIIEVESSWNPRARSEKGAIGLMQLMPETANEMDVDNPYNPKENIEGGVKYLKLMLKRFDNDKKLALAAYNAGPDAVIKYNGIPPYKETQDYYKKVLNIYNKKKNIKVNSIETENNKTAPQILDNQLKIDKKNNEPAKETEKTDLEIIIAKLDKVIARNK